MSIARLLRGTALAACVLGGAGACGHTHTVESAGAAETRDKKADKDKGKDEAAGEAPDEHQEKKHAGASARHDERKDAKPERSGAAAKKKDIDESIPIATSPGGLVEPGAMKKIQEKLAGADLLKSADVSGKLDEPTRRALRRFQDGKDLPATGVPDDETVRKLGLDPKDVFRASDSASPAEQPRDGAAGKHD